VGFLTSYTANINVTENSIYSIAGSKPMHRKNTLQYKKTKTKTEYIANGLKLVKNEQ